jgi:hypothetical protein
MAAIVDFLDSLINETFGGYDPKEEEWLPPVTVKHDTNTLEGLPQPSNVPISEQFLDPDNITDIIRTLFPQLKHKYSLKYLRQMIPINANDWAYRNKIDDSTPLGIDSSIELLEHLNREFVNNQIDLLNPVEHGEPDVNVFRSQFRTQSSDGHWEYKSPEFFTPTDLQTMDVCDDMASQVSVDRSKYRNGNRIPYWQTVGGGSKKVNLVDRSDIDGLKTSAYDASLDCHVRKFDMSSVKRDTRTLRHSKPERRRTFGDSLWTGDE